MTERTFSKTPLAAGVALALGASGFTTAEAQDMGGSPMVDGKPIEEIVTVGIRGSLKASMDIKRQANGVVDAITAEDMGQFPDTNLAESLQRITGVSIDRQRGEGSQVTVRGFGPDYNLVLLNGRQMPTTSPSNHGLGRSFDFGNLASEGIAAVEVYKTGRANVPTGGIGATINVRTTRPLDAPGLRTALAASGMYDESSINDTGWTPEISALFSDTFADDKVGVAISAVYQDRKNGAATASVGGWRSFPGTADNSTDWGGIPPASDPNQQNRPGAGDIYSVPQVIGYELADYERVRQNAQLTLQFRPVDNLTATLDYTYYEVEQDRTYNNLSAWFNFAGQETVWTDGPQASPLEYTENSVGSDFSMGAGSDATKSKTDSAGLNLVWDVGDALSLELDTHHSTANSEPNSKWGDSALLSIAAYTRDRTSGYFATDLPVLQLGLSDPLSPDDMTVTGSVFTNNVSEMTIDQTRLGGNFKFMDSNFFKSIDFGIEFTDVDNRAAGSVVQRDSWSAQTPLGAIADLMRPASIKGAFDQFAGGNDSRLQTDFYTFNMPALIERTESLMDQGVTPIFVPGNGDLGPCGTALCPSPNFTSDRRTLESSKAAYFQVNTETEWGGKPVDMVLGLRYEKTDVTSKALSTDYTGLNWVAGNELTPISSGDSIFTKLKGDYDYWLPNFDFRMDITDQVVGRVSVSKTLTRPNYDAIQGGLTINSPVRIDGGTGARGNPALLPFESDNFDLSLEWYYGENSYVSVGYFKKNVANFIGSAGVTETVFDLPHPTLGPLGDDARAATGATDGGTLYSWILANEPNAEGVDAVNGVISGVPGRDPSAPFNLTVPVNINKASFDGWELNLQHNFGDTGFGFIANATFVDSDVPFDDLDLAQQFVLFGLSDSANLIAFYDKNGIDVRLAYNWRDKFLAGNGQTNVGVGPPSYTGKYDQVDLSASYWINDNMQVFLDAINLTDSTSHVYGRDVHQTLFAVQQGTRYSIGLRYKF
jgi:TonB-dependent receptor